MTHDGHYDESLLKGTPLTKEQIQEGYSADLLAHDAQPPAPSPVRYVEPDEPAADAEAGRPAERPRPPFWRTRNGRLVIAAIVLAIIIAAVVGGAVGGTRHKHNNNDETSGSGGQGAGAAPSSGGQGAGAGVAPSSSVSGDAGAGAGAGAAPTASTNSGVPSALVGTAPSASAAVVNLASALTPAPTPAS